MFMFSAVQAPCAPTRSTQMAVITFFATFATQTRIHIARKRADILRHTGRTSLAEKSPIGSDSSLAINPGRANEAHEAARVVGFAVVGHMAEGKACSAGSIYIQRLEFEAQDPFAGCHHFAHFTH